MPTTPPLPFAAVPLLAQAGFAEAFSPFLLLLLCVVAGLATVYLLPSRREPAVRTVAGVALVAAALIAFAAAPALRNANGVSGAATFYFWAFSAVALVSAVRVVTHPRPVYAALYFVLTVFASAGLFVLTGAEFMAAALVIIYAGAILVTYVFVIMLASQAGDGAGHHDAAGTATDSTRPADYDRDSREPAVAAALGFTLMGVLLFVVFDRAAGPRPVPIPTEITISVRADPAAVDPQIQATGSTQELGLYLVKNQLVQLEVGAVVLLVSMVGAIVITRRRVVHVPLPGEPPPVEVKPEVLHTAATPVDDNPHSIPVYGTDNPRRKAYPQT